MSNVYVSDFVYALGGRKVHVSESEAAGRLLSTAEDLESAGFRWHHICEPGDSAYDLAESVTAQLADTGRLAAIDAIVYATCLPLNGNIGSPADFERTRDVKHLMDFPASRLQARFELNKAVVLGLNQQACTAMPGSIRLAGAMLTAEPNWRRVLCVTADRFPEGAIYEQAYNLISDGGAACLVSREPTGFRLVTAHQITNGALGRASDDETVGSYFSHTHRLFKETLERSGLTAAGGAGNSPTAGGAGNPPTAGIDWVVPQNTNDKAWQILARLLGIPLERVWSPSMSDVGHVISADNIVNLAHLVASGQLRPGQRVALMMAGFGLNWQCLILEAV